MLLIDSMALAYRSKHAMKKSFMSFKENGGNRKLIENEVIFTFLDQIKSICQRTKEKDLVFLWDGPSELNVRKKIYSDYKAKEEVEKTPEEEEYDDLAQNQFSILMMDIIPSLGFKNSFMFIGYESDDLIAVACQKASEENKMIIVSSDNDLYQLLTDHVSMYVIHNKEIFTKKDFIEKYNIMPDEWWCVKCYAGDSSDNVPNIPGVKEKTAIKYIKGKLPSHYKAHMEISKEENIPIIERNEELVRLPFVGTPNFEIKKHSLYQADFQDTFDKYGFKAFLGDDFYKWVFALRLK